jgi:hypothetical protein
VEFTKKTKETNKHRNKLTKRKNKMRMENKPHTERAEIQKNIYEDIESKDDKMKRKEETKI